MFGQSAFEPARRAPVALNVAQPPTSSPLPPIDPNKVPFIDQYDLEGDGPSYCAPADVVMALQYFDSIGLPQSVRLTDPDRTVQVTASNGNDLVQGLFDGYSTTVSGNGTDENELRAMLQGANLKYFTKPSFTGSTLNTEWLNQQLDSGRPVMIHGKGHWMLVIGHDGNGGYTIRDSANPAHTSMTEGELRTFVAGFPNGNMFALQPVTSSSGGSAPYKPPTQTPR